MTDSPPPDAGADMTVREVAKRLRISRWTVYRLLRDDQFPTAYRLAGSYRIPQSGVQDFVARKRVGG